MTLAAFFRSMAPGSVCAVIAAPQEGKSTLVQSVDAQVFTRRVAFDTYARLDRLRHKAGEPNSRPWPGRVVWPAELVVRPSMLDFEPIKLVVGPRDTDDEAVIARDFSDIAPIIWKTGGVWLVAEEFGTWGRYASQWVHKFATGGGHSGSRLIMLAQSWRRIQIDAREAVTHIVAGPQVATGDAEELRKRCGPEFAARVAALKSGSRIFLKWRFGVGEV